MLLINENADTAEELREAEAAEDENQENEEVVEIIKPKVLVIDDNAILLRTVKDMLTEGYDVAIAASAAQAFKAIEKQKPEVILLDYEMPVVNGEEMLKQLRADPNTADIPVIFLTGAADKDTVVKLLSLKPAGYVLKPPNKELLTELLEKALPKTN